MTQTVLLDEVAFFQEGPGMRNWQYVDSGGVPFVNIRCLVDGRLDRNSMSQINMEDANVKYKHFQLKENDILVSSSGTLGRLAEVRKEDLPCILNTSVIRFKPLDDRLDRRYLKYFLVSDNYLEQVTGMATGSAQQNYGPSHLKKVRIPLPEISIQQKIGDILGTLDEKIELNRKMNETLEQMGQALFRHYFITNPAAKKWGKISIGKNITPRRGKSLQSRNMQNGTIPVVSGGLQPAGYHNESNTKPPVITVSASGANAGFVALWNKPVWSADSSFIDTTITQNVYFYYLFMKANQNRIYGMQTGSGQPHIYPKHIEMLEIPNAPDHLIGDFNNEVAPMFDRIEHNKHEIQTLTTLRDTLLPRLISGKVKL